MIYRKPAGFLLVFTQVRHGAATGLREIIKVHGQGAGKTLDSSVDEVCTVSNACILLHVCTPGNHLNQGSLGSWKVVKFKNFILLAWKVMES